MSATIPEPTVLKSFFWIFLHILKALILVTFCNYHFYLFLSVFLLSREKVGKTYLHFFTFTM